MLVLNIVFLVRFFFLGWLVLVTPKRAEAVQLLEEMGKGPLGQAGAGCWAGTGQPSKVFTAPARQLDLASSQTL